MHKIALFAAFLAALLLAAAASPPLWGQFGQDATRSRRSSQLGPAQTPTLLWSSDDVNAAAALLVTGDGDVVFGGTYGTVTLLDGATGATKAHLSLNYDIQAKVSTTALSEDGKIVYAGLNPASNSGETLYALDATSLGILWSAALGGGGFVAPLLVLNGTVYATPMRGGRNSVIALNGATGERKWSVAMPPEAFYVSCGPVASPDGRNLYVVGSPCVAAAFDSSNGTLLWSATVPDCSEASGTDYDAPPSISADGALLIAPTTWSVGSQLFAYDVRTGAVVWRKLYNKLGVSAVAVDAAAYVSVPGALQAIALNGTGTWSTGAALGGDASGSPALDAAGTLFVASSPGRCVAGLSSASGVQLWRWCSDDSTLTLLWSPMVNGPVIGANGTLYVVGGHTNVGKATVIALQAPPAKRRRSLR